MNLRFDKPLLAALAGALATIPYEILTRIIVSLGIGKYSVYQLASLIVTLNRPTATIGMLVSWIAGGTIAVLLYFALEKIGTDYLLLKSISISLLGWLILEAVYVWLIEGPKLVPARPVSDYFIELIGTIFFGFVLGLLLKSFVLKIKST